MIVTVKFRLVERAHIQLMRASGKVIQIAPAAHSRWEDLAGRPVAVYLPPERPHEPWPCGAEWLWRLTEAAVTELAGRPLPDVRIFVCEHQVDVD